MTTIKLKNGSGAPDAADLVQGEVALDLTNKRIYSENASGTVIEMGTSPSTIDINAGTIDGTVIGGASAAAGTFTTLNATGGGALTGTWTNLGTVSTVDINGGTIDGTTIGGASAGAGTFTTLQANTSLNVDGTVTADGLTVDGTTLFLDGTFTTGSTPTITLGDSATYFKVLYGSNAAIGGYTGVDIFGTASGNKIATFANGGDISFYEDTGVTPKMVWKAADERLGIGTDSPARPLSVSTTGYEIASFVASGAETNIQIQNTGTNGRNWSIVAGGNGGAFSSGQFGIYDSTATAARLAIDSAGNVGIGATSPGARLTVAGVAPAASSPATYPGTIQINETALSTLQSTGGLEFRGAVFGSGYGSKITSSDTGDLLFGNRSNSAAWTKTMHLSASGNLGLGVTPGVKLDVSYADTAYNAGIRVKNTTNNAASQSKVYVVNDADEYFSLGRNSTALGSQSSLFSTGAYPIGFYTNSTLKATLDSSGNLLVGTTTNGRQDLNSITIEPKISCGGYAVFNHETGSSSGRQYIDFAFGGTQIGSITQSGTTAVAYNTSSDYRLKNITGPITNSGNYIDSLNPVEGTWKADGFTFVGLIAHEVQEVSRTSVATGEKDGKEMQGMDYSSAEIIANLIAEVKALRQRVATLESN